VDAAERSPGGGVANGTVYVMLNGGVGDLAGVGDLSGGVEGRSVGEDGASTSVDEISGDAALHG